MKKKVIFLILSLLVLGMTSAIVALRPWDKPEHKKTLSAESSKRDNRTSTAKEEVFYVTSPEGLVLRATPGASGERYGLLPYAGQVRVFHHSGNRETIGGREGEWVKVRSQWGEGWVFSGWLDGEQPGPFFDLTGLWLVQEIDGNPADSWATGNQEGAVFWRWDDIGGQHFFEFGEDGRYAGGRYATGCGESGRWNLTGDTLSLDGLFGIDSMSEDEFETVSVEYRLTPEDPYHVRLAGEVNMLLVRVDTELEQLCRKGDTDGLGGYIDKVGPVDVRLMYDNTTLFFAVLSENPEAVRFLLDQGVDVNARNIYGMTALHAACEGYRAEGMLPVVRVLLEYGADPALTDNRGQTPMDKTLGYSGGDVEAIRALFSIQDDSGNLLESEKG